MEAANPPISRASAGRSRFGIVPIGIALVTLIVLAVVGYVLYARFVAATPAPAFTGTPVAARKGNVTATVSATGSVVASRQSRLALTSAGRLKEIGVRLGDEVKAGTLLARVDTAALDLKLAQARSNLRTSQLKLEQLRSGARPEEIASAEASVRSAQARVAELEGGALPQDVQQAQASVESAAASVRQAAARRDQVRSGATASDVSAAEQAVQSALSSLQRAELDLQKVKAGATADEIRQAELSLEQSRNSLWSQQISRDATCSRIGGSCEAANAQVAAAESGVSQAQARLEALRNKPDARDVQSAQAAVDAARESHRAAQVKLDQIRRGPTAEEVGQVQAGLDSALANQQSALSKLDAIRQGARAADVQAARSALVQAQSQLALKRAPATAQETALAEEAVRVAEIQVKQAELELENASLVAPFDGVVGAIAANVGEQVGGGTALLTLVDPKAVRIDVSVDETDIARIASGKTASITFDALPERRFNGKVIGIAPNATVQQGVATYVVAVSVDDATDVTLPPGMTANVAIVIAQRDNVVTVPNRAIRRVGRNQVVDVLVGDKPETRPVKTGLGNEQITEVLEGVADGDMVVIPATTTQVPRVGGFPGGGPPPGAGPQVVVKPQAKP